MQNIWQSVGVAIIKIMSALCMGMFVFYNTDEILRNLISKWCQHEILKLKIDIEMFIFNVQKQKN